MTCGQSIKRIINNNSKGIIIHTQINMEIGIINFISKGIYRITHVHIAPERADKPNKVGCIVSVFTIKISYQRKHYYISIGKKYREYNRYSNH
jgi:hypothetical protein